MSLDSCEALSDQDLAFIGQDVMERPAILIVDDEPQLVTAMTDALDEQYRVVGETSPQKALDILEKNHDIQVIISDQRMPVMPGDEFLFRAREISPATRILVTAYADLGAVTNAVNRGKIFNYVRKPWDETELRGIVDTAAQHFALSAALQQERALLKCIMDCSVDAISVKDSRHRYIRLNHAEAAMLGADSPEQIKGRTHAEFLAASRAACWSEEEERLLETLEALRERTEHVVEQDGTDRWYAATKAPIKSSSGVPIGLVSVARNITESKSIEQIKDDFVSTARHELRTPLTVIMNSIKLIRTGRFGQLTPKIDELLIHADANCDRLHRLINNMLDLQDITVGRVGIERAPVAICELINEARALSERLAKENEIDVQVDAPLRGVTIMGDRRWLIQALSNLLSNACKFSPEGTTVTITVSEEADQVRISVIDQGRGLPKGVTDRLFKTFGQLDSSASRAYEGAGLGLRVCKAIVEAHGGRIGYMPAPDQGSNFFMVLPRDRSA
ncbi:MAG TPA: ATP-binding protein [Hyphomicrobiales bacterium]|jgi:PAS domain S-box-containing protein